MACNLKNTKLLDCALIEVCAVIGSNMVVPLVFTSKQETFWAFRIVSTLHSINSLAWICLIVFLLLCHLLWYFDEVRNMILL